MADSEHKAINLIVMAHINYPYGMAKTKRIQNILNYLKNDETIQIRVLVLRQERVKLTDYPLSGTFNGIDYKTIGSDIKPGIGAIFKLPKYIAEGRRFLKDHYRENCKNIVYVYGYPSTDNFAFISHGKSLGYKFIFDIVEDIAFQSSSKDILAKLKHLSCKLGFKMLGKVADAVLVISKHLENKVKQTFKDRFDVHLFPISVDFNNFPELKTNFHQPVQIFYGGTFGDKDGVENLIRAFEKTCEHHENIQLILCGKGSDSRMKNIHAMIESSDYAGRIEYKGYVPDKEFYPLMNRCDILCMTRVKSAFANTGFPFKLGEYLATGRPVVASEVSDVSMFLKDRESACLIEPDSVDSITEALHYLLENPGKALEIGRKGRQAALEHFNAEKLADTFRQWLIEI